MPFAVHGPYGRHEVLEEVGISERKVGRAAEER